MLFRSGPVALATSNSADMVVNLQGCAFKWATRKNVLRCSVAFVQLHRYSKSVGVCMVKCTKEAFMLMRRLEKYCHAHYVGKVSKNEHLYTFIGRATHLGELNHMAKAA
mgnify:CR=1 FL=1